MSKPNNPPAFPQRQNVILNDEKGMTLRDYFAAKAMQALLEREPVAINDHGKCAEWAYRIADAMLTERAK